MSQSGELIFYTEQRHAEPRSLLTRLLEKTGAESIFCATRTIGEERDWDIFRRARRRPWRPLIDADELSTPSEDFDDTTDLRALPLLYQEGTALRIMLGVCPLGDRMWAAIQRHVPSDIRGDFCPGEVGIEIGAHDLFECAEHDNGLYIARAFVSIEFFSYSTPNDWEQTRKSIYEVPEVKRIKAEIESVTGQLQQTILWSV